jgi:hypothetical protein
MHKEVVNVVSLRHKYKIPSVYNYSSCVNGKYYWTCMGKTIVVDIETETAEIMWLDNWTGGDHREAWPNT